MRQERHQITFEQSFWVNKLDREDPRQVELLTEHRLIEHKYDPFDEESYEGDEYKNIHFERYIFEFPQMWRNIYDKDLSMSIRSINCCPFPRTLVLSGLQLWYFPDPTLTQGDEDYNIDHNLSGPIFMDLNIHVALPAREGMTEANLNIQTHLLQIYQNQPEEYHNVWGRAPISIFYNHQTSEFTFNITLPKYLLIFHEESIAMSDDWKYFTNTSPDDFYSIGPGFHSTALTIYGPEGIQGSDYIYNDWKQSQYYNQNIWFYGAACKMKGTEHQEQYAHTDGSIYYETEYDWMRGLTQMKIKNIWGRERMIVKSNLDPYNEYIGYTNTTYGPPKTYKMNNWNKTFWIELYDAISGEHVFLPRDGKDTLVIEAQFIAE
jgi:hypothetical protein